MEEITNSFINGQIKQGKKQLQKLSLQERVTFIESYYFESLSPKDKEIILECLITRDFK